MTDLGGDEPELCVLETLLRAATHAGHLIGSDDQGADTLRCACGANGSDTPLWHCAEAGAAALEEAGVLPAGGAEIAMRLGVHGPLRRQTFAVLVDVATGILAEPP